VTGPIPHHDAPQKRGPGRPKLSGTERRKKRGDRWSDAEWAEVQRRAAEAGLTAAEYLRRCALGQP